MIHRLKNFDADDAAQVAALIVGGLGYTLSALILVPHILSCFLINKMYTHLDKQKEEGITRSKDYENDSPYYVTMSLVEIVTTALKRKGKVGAASVVPEETESPPTPVNTAGEFYDGDYDVISSEELGVENTLQPPRGKSPNNDE